jgi:hypothetical protein
MVVIAQKTDLNNKKNKHKKTIKMIKDNILKIKKIKSNLKSI